MSDPALADLSGVSAAADWVVAALLALVGGGLGAWAALRLSGSRRRAEGGDALRFRVEDGKLWPLSRAARRWLGAQGDPRTFTEADARLRLVEGAAPPAAAIAALEETGAALRLLVEDASGAAWEMRGGVEAGEARLSLTPAGPALREVAKLRAALAAAQAERAALHEALDAAPALIWRRDPDGALTWGNARFRALSGAEADAPPPELTADGASLAKAGRHAIFDARSGERMWFETQERPARDGGALGYGFDAAAAVHAEAALRRFVETLTETFAHLRVGLAIFDREQRLGLFNPAFSELMRLDPAWLAGRPAFPEVLTRLREGRMAPDQADFGEWRRSMLEMFGDGTDMRSDRTEIWQLPGEVMIRVVARPHPQGAVAFLFEDVSETARLERRWFTETETRRAMMDRLEEGVAAFGPDGAVRFANPAFARIWGLRADGEADAGPLRLSEALVRFRAQSADTPAWDRLAAFFDHPAGRAPWSEVVRLSDGRRLRARVAALPDGSVLTAFTDVTDAARAESALRDRAAALEAAEEVRTALIEQMSRRIRTPLHTIAGFAQMLREGTEGAALSPRQHGYADGILDAAADIQDAMSGVADLASAQSGAIALDSGPVDLGAALSAAMVQADRMASRRGVHLSLERPEGAGIEAVAGDAARVRQILVNLLSDAVQRSRVGGSVRAGVRAEGGQVSIWTDAAADRDDLGPKGPRRTGLAHALVRRFAELHGGEVRVELIESIDLPPDAPAELGEERRLPFGDPGPAPRVRVTCALPSAATLSGNSDARDEVA